MEWLPACNPDDVPIDRLVAGELFTKKNTLKNNCTDALTPNVIFLHTQQMLEGTRQVASIMSLCCTRCLSDSGVYWSCGM